MSTLKQLKNSPDRLTYWRNYRLKNKDKCRQYEFARRKKKAIQTKEWALRNKERRLEINRKYRLRHLNAFRQKNKEWYESHIDYVRVKSKEYRDKNKAKIKLRLKLYHKKRYREDPVYRQKMIDNSKKWKALNVEAYKKIRRNHQKTHLGSYRVVNAKRRALKKAATVNLASIKDFIVSVKGKKQVTCYYCQRRIPSFGCHFDHIIPLSKGGAHSIENLCVSCASCNSRKNDKDFSAFIKIGQQLLAL